MLYYIHIPKSAGTSFRNFLKTAIYGDGLTEVYFELGYWNAPAYRCTLPADAVLYGHFCYGLHKLLRDRQPRYITLMRHPVERLMSYYKHQRLTPGARWHSLITSENLSLADFVEGGYTPETNNHVTRMLSADYGRVKRWQSHVYNAYSRWRGGPPAFQVHARRSMLRALRNLREDFQYVGLTEHFEDAGRFLLELHGLAPERYFEPRDNQLHLEGFAIDAAAQRAVENTNELDLELYQTVAGDLPRYQHRTFPPRFRGSRQGVLHP